MHQSTLMRYESGAIAIPDDVYTDLSAVLGLDDLHTKESSRELVVGVPPFPDSVILTFALTFRMKGASSIKFGGFNARDSFVSSNKILEALALGGTEEGGVDIALYNEPNWKEPSNHKDKVLSLGAAVQFRGYALLSPSGCGLKVFSQCMYEAKGASRKERVEHALTTFVLQFKGKKEDVEFYFPADTDMEFLLMSLFDNKSVGNLRKADKEAAESISERISKTDELDEHQALARFVERLKSNNGNVRALFIGGLTQRLIAEQQGAQVMLSDDDLYEIATVLDKKMLERFRPNNLLLVNREAIEKDPAIKNIIIGLWNECIERIKHEESVRSILELFAFKKLSDAMQFEKSDPSSLSSTDLLNHVLGAPLIELLPLSSGDD